MAEKRITFRGKRFNERTRDMLLWTEKQIGYQVTLTQGSYNTSVAQSGGTHAGGGALDCWGAGMNAVGQLVLQLRRAGFAAWHRTPAQGDWGHHVHAIAVGDDDLSSAAQRQVVAYRNGRNGLANNLRDDGPDGFRLMTWELRQQLDKLNQNTNSNGDDVNEDQFNALANLMRQAINQSVSDTNIDKNQTAILTALAKAEEARAAADAARDNAIWDFLNALRRDLGIQFNADAARDASEASSIDALSKKVDALPK